MRQKTSPIRLYGLLLLWVTALLCACATPPPPKRILFIGNSFTYGEGSIVKTYAPGSVHDLNANRHSGVPALFREMAAQAGLLVDVSIEAMSGAGLDVHYMERHPAIDRAWDQVVMHGYSTLDRHRSGDAGLLIQYTQLFIDLLTARQPQVDVRLMSTWARADQTYPPSAPWYGKPISAMLEDIDRGYRQAFDSTPKVRSVIPVGAAWNIAMERGFADANPYDGIARGQVNLWAPDHYHASKYGSYLQALTIFGSLSGRDPRSLGANETVARALGISPTEATAMQGFAQAALAAELKRPPPPEPKK